MKTYLLYPGRDFDWSREPIWNEETLIQDLDLDVLYQAMAQEDGFFYNVAKKVVPVSMTDVDEITYRQAVFADCIKNEAVVRTIYALAVEALALEKKSFYWVFSSSASGILHSARDLIAEFVVILRKIRVISDEQVGDFASAGFFRFFSMVSDELNDEYFGTMEQCLRELKLGSGVLMSAKPGTANKGEEYILRKPNERDPNFWHRLFAKRAPSRAFRIADRDENGARALSELEARGLNHVANALAQSADHIKSFFSMLQAELAFYLGGLNLRQQLIERGMPICFPTARALGHRAHKYEDLYDVGLALKMRRAPIANTADGSGRDLIVVTGANQGGKSTYLRSVGVAQMMLQAGMFVGAGNLEANIVSSILTHYKREEDVSLRGGKFDEELRRMSTIVDHMKKDALFLSNESFSSTNEREGSNIGRQIVDVLLEKKIKVVLVTHLYTLARGLFEELSFPALYLRAERHDDGTRTFKLVEGEPLQTSFGQDLYRQIFGRDLEPGLHLEVEGEV